MGLDADCPRGCNHAGSLFLYILRGNCIGLLLPSTIEAVYTLLVPGSSSTLSVPDDGVR